MMLIVDDDVNEDEVFQPRLGNIILWYRYKTA